VCAAGSAGTALAQCNISRYGIPDFDQRRSYLPGNGDMYCVPTSCTNMMGYMANHGYAVALNHASSNWAAPAEYPFVNVRDYNMGLFMDTSATGGTTLGGAMDGLLDYFDWYNIPGWFILCSYYADDGWAPSPHHVASLMGMNGLVSICYGRYNLEDGSWRRHGGHCVTASRVSNACGSSPSIGYKDPWTSDSNTVQSPFETHTWDLEAKFASFGGDNRTQWGTRGATGNTGRAFLDNEIFILPLFGFTNVGFHASELIRYNLAAFSNLQTQDTDRIPTPGNAPIISAAMDVRCTQLLVATAAVGFTPAHLWSYDLADSRFTSLQTFTTDPIAMQTDRFGNAIVLLGSTVRKFKVTESSATEIGVYNTGTSIKALAVDDKTDDIYVLADGRRWISRFPGGNLGAQPTSLGLPQGVVLGENPSIAFHPKERLLWITSDASPAVYELTPPPPTVGGPYAVSETLDVSSTPRPLSLRFTDKGMIQFISNDRVREFERNTDGRYVPAVQTLFAGRRASGFLAMPTSRTNFDPRRHVGPAFDNLLNPSLNTPVTRDCRADFNYDGTVDFFDYLDFVQAFDAQSMEADFNFDGALDFFDYLDFAQAFDAGC
jgi:hypothetical protein